MSDKESRKQFVRIWVELDMNDVKQHLLICDESMGSCAVCREFGINLQTVKTCPQCGTEFRYATTRPSGPGKSADFKILQRIRDKRPDLTMVDWADFDRGQGKVSAREFLKL